MAGVHPCADRDARTAAWLFGLGAFGIVLTCVGYVLAGAQAALPGGASTLASAQWATAQAQPWMRWAGAVGMPSDVLFAVGACLWSRLPHRPAARWNQAGWLAMALASALFVVVDALVSRVLPVAALGAAGVGAYAELRALFDALFSIAAWALAAGALAASAAPLGALAASAAPLGAPLRWQALRALTALAGVVGLAANTGYWLGLPTASWIGPGVALAALAMLGIGAGIVLRPAPSLRIAAASTVASEPGGRS